MNISIFGSTGSIGRNTLDVVRRLPGRFRIISLSANSNTDILLRQIREFHPRYVCVKDSESAVKLSKAVSGKTKILTGEDGLLCLAEEKKTQKIMLAISGSDALMPLIKAIESGKQIALANKEALVIAGPIIMKMLKNSNASIIPVDSEQSAIWQCLEGRDRYKLNKIYLTASGGPLLRTKKNELRNISIGRVLNHPRWIMGKKISVDSATLMNKGLEFLEAMFLFNIPAQKVKILIHPEAIIHSMVEFNDGIIIAQLSIADMRIPIQYALTYPERMPKKIGSVDFFRLKSLNFEKPDTSRFPCLELAYQAARKLGTYPCVLNAANEVSVESFLDKRINFVSIPKIIEKVLGRHHNIVKPDLCAIQGAQAWAKEEARRLINRLN